MTPPIYRGVFPVGEYSWGWGTWLVGILPYVEQQNLYELYQGYGGIGAAGGIDANVTYSASINQPVNTNINSVSHGTLNVREAPVSEPARTGHAWVASIS